MSILALIRKITGVILILLVPIAIALPGLPGDVMLITGLCLISDRISNWVKAFISKHKKIIGVISLIWLIIFWGYWLYRLIG